MVFRSSTSPSPGKKALIANIFIPQVSKRFDYTFPYDFVQLVPNQIPLYIKGSMLRPGSLLFQEFPFRRPQVTSVSRQLRAAQHI